MCGFLISLIEKLNSAPVNCFESNPPPTISKLLYVESAATLSKMQLISSLNPDIAVHVDATLSELSILKVPGIFNLNAAPFSIGLFASMVPENTKFDCSSPVFSSVIAKVKVRELLGNAVNTRSYP